METKAQKTKAGRENYGKNRLRGSRGELKVKRMLEEEGYTVKVTANEGGFADITAKKGNETRKIQVKRISSRRFLTPEAARNRIAGAPFNVKRLAPNGELWVFDRDGRLYVFKGGVCVRGYS